MSTHTLQINFNTRPVRIAFLIDKPDAVTLERVFKLNTILWGGMLNPVVVIDGSSRAQVGAYYRFENATYEEEQLSLLKAFDPDILINYCSVQLPAFLAPFKERTFPPEVMRWNPWGTKEIMAFLEVWPFLEHYWREEVRFLPKPNVQHGYIDLEAPGAPTTFLAARFGSYPKESDGNLMLANNFGGKLVTYHEDFRKSYSPDEWVFPIKITTLQLNIPTPSKLESHIFFLLDADNMFDIVDYWNLRAAGYRVFPLPTTHYRDFEKSAKEFAELSVYPINQNVMTLAEVVKARSVDNAEWEDSAKWFASLGVNTGQLSLKGWVPRFTTWLRDQRIRPEMEILPPVSEESSEIVVFDNGRGTLRVNGPSCGLTGPYLSQHWATELQILGSTDEQRTFRLPWLRPQCDSLANRNVGRGDIPYSARVSLQGIVVQEHGDRETIWIEEPTLAQVLQAYLLDGGFTYLKTSAPGLALERIVEQMGGLTSCRVFQNSGVRKIIESLSHGSRMPANDVVRIIHTSLRSDEGAKWEAFNSILTGLVEAEVLRQGFELQCNRCQRRDWYHLSELGTDFKCKKCFHVQRVPNLQGMAWHYVSDGLFRLEGKAAGSLTSILSLLFLRDFLGSEASYVPSFDYADGTAEGERDFAVFASPFLQGDVDVIIGECKSLGELEENQKDDIKQLGLKTGGYIAFCTLADTFSQKDVLFFEQLVIGGQRLILLTRKHLEMPYTKTHKYRYERRWVGRRVELISRLTTREVLGDSLADTYGITL